MLLELGHELLQPVPPFDPSSRQMGIEGALLAGEPSRSSSASRSAWSAASSGPAETPIQRTRGLARSERPGALEAEGERLVPSGDLPENGLHPCGLLVVGSTQELQGQVGPAGL